MLEPDVIKRAGERYSSGNDVTLRAKAKMKNIGIVIIADIPRAVSK